MHFVNQDNIRVTSAPNDEETVQRVIAAFFTVSLGAVTRQASYSHFALNLI